MHMDILTLQKSMESDSMMKKRRKTMDKKVITILVSILIILAINFIMMVNELIDYEKRKENGNNRWLQVENRIMRTEEKINLLEEERRWKN